jgi:putative exosortase-associated protein (TIGR04073 family)
MFSANLKTSLVVFWAIFLVSLNVPAESTVTDRVESTSKHTVTHNLLRGTANLGLGILELPKQMCHQSTKIPVIGIVPGICAGTGLSIWRICSGLSDLLTFGFGGGESYFLDLPEYPWQGKWFPPPKPKSEQNPKKNNSL